MADKLSSSELWDILSSEQREAFSKLVKSGQNDTTLEWLNEGVLDIELTLPWWEAPELEEESDGPILIHHDDTTRMKKYGRRPQPVAIPDALLRQPPGPPLLYNICAVL